MLLTLIKKDLTHEARTLESLCSILLLSLLVSTILAFGSSSAMLGPPYYEKLFPSLLCVGFFLCATVGISRSFEHELEHRALDGLIVSGVKPELLYLSKIIVAVIFSLIAQLILLVSLSVLMNVSISALPLGSLWVLLLVSIGYSALICLTIVIATASRLKSVLLPLIALPLMFPLFFAATELFADIIAYRVVNYEAPMLSLLVGIDVVYIVLGFNLYPYLVRE